MANYKVSDNQSLFDIAIQELGSVSSVFELADLNDLSITDYLTPGDELKLPAIKNSDLQDYFRAYNIKPATDATVSDMDALRDEGIDYWAIEVDFVVQ